MKRKSPIYFILTLMFILGLISCNKNAKTNSKSNTKSNIQLNSNRDLASASSKAMPLVLPKKGLVITDAKQRSISYAKKVVQKNINQPKYRTLYVMTYKDKVKTHEFKFLKDISNHKNTILKWKTDKKILVKKIDVKDALAIERGFKKIWGDSKYRTPSRVNKCTTYINISSLSGKHTVCAENQKLVLSARNFLNELNIRFKTKK